MERPGNGEAEAKGGITEFRSIESLNVRLKKMLWGGSGAGMKYYLSSQNLKKITKNNKRDSVVKIKEGQKQEEGLLLSGLLYSASGPATSSPAHDNIDAVMLTIEQ